MDYRLTSRTGYEISALSYGCARFVDDESAVRVVQKAVELGVNYFDVAPLYADGHAERRLALGLQGLDRSQLIISAKSTPGGGSDEVQTTCDPTTGFGIRTADQVRRQIERSMDLLGVEHLDMYNFWAVNSEAVIEEGFRPGGFMAGVLKAHEEGLLDHIGMTTHADGESIIRYLQYYPFGLVIMPFHLRDTSRANAVEYCAENGIAVLAMNPLAGGRLARTSPVLRRIAAESGFASLTEAALRFVAGFPGVTSALSGMTYAEQVSANVEALAQGSLPADKAATLQERLVELYANVQHFCTACGYCGACPEGILIPQLLEAYTDTLLPSAEEQALAEFAEKLAADPVGYDPARCTACQACEAKCPNQLPISEMMSAAKAHLVGP